MASTNNTAEDNYWAAVETEECQLERKGVIRFKCFHDIMLLREVISQNPFGHGYPKRRWDSVALKFRAYMPEVSSRCCRERTLRLLKLYKNNDIAGLRRSGSEEQNEERERLLQEIKDLERQGTNKDDSRKETGSLAQLCSTEAPSASEDEADEILFNCIRGNSRKRGAPCATLAEYLTKKHSAEMAVKEKDRKIRIAELEIEKRRLAIEERRLDLETERWKEEKEDRREQRNMLIELLKLVKDK